MTRTPNPEQLAAIEAPGLVFVSAGAGTGKTTVLVERFVRAVCERGLSIDSLLVITYTDRAAGELSGRIRERLNELERKDLADQLDGGWISTIHGFCKRLLRENPFSVGLDPHFRVLDESQATVLRQEAFDRALEAFCADDDRERVALLATYGRRALRKMLIGVYATLCSAGRDLVLELGSRPDLDERRAELIDSAAALANDPSATDSARAAAARTIEFLEERTLPERLLDLSDHSAGRTAAAVAYEQARKALEQAARDELALHHRDLLQALLESFAACYREAKEVESAVDFDDLQLLARDLLRSDEAVRERERSRFRSIMVDEFQDTNLLQCELVDLLAGTSTDGASPGCDLFFVGDEFQSIYSFRHADVEVFRERRAQSGGVFALTHNYRSRPELLAVVNHLFASDFGDDYQPLEAAGRLPDPSFGAAVELLVTDKASYQGAPVNWREGEAQQVARRVKELVDAGDATAGEIVLLFAAGTDAEIYEQALRAHGLPTYRATGRGYFGQQQVVDLLMYLRLLHNRYDDEALAAVLASPFVGVSNDALVLMRRSIGRRPLFVSIEKGPPSVLAETDEGLIRAFLQRYERLTRVAETVSLEQLCERVVSEHDYDLAVLAQWDGKRRYANLRKLGRLARSYEDLRGPDIEGFVRFVRDQDDAGARELEAVAEEEGADAVRLLTIHSAKGLEFKVVVVADAGRERNPRGRDEILALPDGRFGFKVADPSTGERRPAFDYEAVHEAEREQQEAERRRLYYVAMTRAIDRLIISGSIDPERKADQHTPIGWVLERLDAREFEAEIDKPLVIERDGARLLARVDRYRPDRAAPAAAAPATELAPEPGDAGGAGEAGEAGQLALFAELADLPPAPPPAPLLPALEPVPAPPLHRARSLSFSSIAEFERCSYRYYARKVVGMKERRGDRHADPGAPAGMLASEIGDAVHFLLEAVDLHAPQTPEPDAVAAAVREKYPGATDEELERIRTLVAAYCDSPLAASVAGLPSARPERPFVFAHDGVLLHGRIDVLALDGPRAYVLDYKSNALFDETPEEIVEHEYRLQRLVYALACFRAGAEEVEIVYQFLERPQPPISATFTTADVPALEAELSEAIGRIQAGEFRPTPSEMGCSDCPARGIVCAGMELRDFEPRDRAAPPIAV